jgi:hypothetical protein
VSENSISLYKKYIDRGGATENLVENSFPKIFSFNKEKSFVEIIEPIVTAKSESIYRTCLNVGLYGPNEPSFKSISIYEDFIKNISK